MRITPFFPLVALALVALPARARTVTLRRLPARTAPRVATPQDVCHGTAIAGHCLPPPRCADAELDLDGLCVPARLDAPDDMPNELATNSHVDRTGHLVVYEHIPRRPDLPAEYARYEYPVPPWHGRTVSSGYDLGLADALQRRGAELLYVGHGGVDLPQERGTPVHVLSLRGEVGEASVLFAGTLFGTTVVLHHVVRDGATLRSYVALHGHLDAIAPGIVRGQSVAPGTVIGFVGDTGAIGIVHLHYETRLVRSGLDPMRVDPATDIIRNENSVPCDPRNLLPMRTEPIVP